MMTTTRHDELSEAKAHRGGAFGRMLGFTTAVAVTAAAGFWAGQVTTISSDAVVTDAEMGRRIGQIEVEVERVKAVAERVTQMAGIDEAEFAFKQPAPAGGPDGGTLAKRSNKRSAVELSKVLAKLDDRKRKLLLIESLITERKLGAHTTPSGWPIVKAGYVSSNYGWRRHPISGKRRMHKGIDIAAPRGTPIVAMADGVVTFSGKQRGYGNIVIVSHGNGLETRYAHNTRNTVKKGTKVKQGDVIAKVGSTGRATGPHVHFEVRKNGKSVNPKRFLDMSRARLKKT